MDAAMNWKLLLRALRHRNYRLFLIGQGVSLIGTWMQQLAMAWLVYRLTDSVFLLGVVGFASQIPVVFLAPLAGVIVDRVNQHRTLLVTQSLAMLQAFLLAALAYLDVITVVHITALSAFLGAVNIFDMTTRQAFLIAMVPERQDLANAIALNSSMVNGARLVGPALAGLALAQVGAATCFFLNGISFLAVLAALLAMDVPPRKSARPTTRIHQGLAEGFAYVFGFAPIRALLLLLALTSFVVLPYTVLLPVFAVNVLHGGPETFGLLSAASGVGALIGALYLAARQSVLGLGTRIALAPAVAGLGLIGFGLSRGLWVSMATLLVVSMAVMVQMAASNTLLQTLVEEDKRGRVMSFYALAFLGMTPLGSFLAGILASRLDAPRTVMLGGICSIIGAAMFALELPRLRQQVRPIYVQMGILPQVARGIQTASELTSPPESQ
jgi:MFS family permease